MGKAKAEKSQHVESLPVPELPVNVEHGVEQPPQAPSLPGIETEQAERSVGSDPLETSEVYRVFYCEALNLRKEPDRAAEVVGVLPHWTPVTATGRWTADGMAVWMPVEAEGIPGWVDARFLVSAGLDFGRGDN